MKSSITLIVIAAAIQVAAAEPAANYFDTPEYDRVDDCAHRLALDFRYDFNRPEISAAAQATAAFELACKSEIADFAPVAGGWNRYAPGRQSVRQRVEENVLIKFTNLRYDLMNAEVSDTPPPLRGNVLIRGARWSIFPHASPLSSAEVVHVRRRDTSGWDAYVSFHGRLGDWDYRYEADPSSGTPALAWQANLRRGSSEVWINCSAAGSPDTACRVSFYRSTDTGQRERHSLLVQGGGHPFVIHALCDPGGEGVVIHGPQTPDTKARDATLTIDSGTPITLPDGDNCIDDKTGTVTQRLLSAQRVATAYKPPFSERLLTMEVDIAAVAPALAVAQHLFDVGRNDAAMLQLNADVKSASELAEPYTLKDALQFDYEWSRALSCLYRARAARPAPSRNDGDCAAPLSDFDWRAVRVGAGYGALSSDDPTTLQAAAATIQAAHAALSAEVERRLADGHAPVAPDHFGPGERPVSVAGAPGWRGFISIDSGAIFDPVAYGYRIAKDEAIGVVVGRYLNGLPSIVIHCRAAAKPHCHFRVPFQAADGAFAIDSDGGRAGGRICVTEVAVSDLRDWFFVPPYSNKGWRIQPDHCAGSSTQAVLTHLMDYGNLSIAPEGQKGDSEKLGAWGSDVHVALALASFLSQHLDQ